MQELKEIDRWLELYETHDKYKFVGHLVDDPVNEILEHVGDDSEGGEEGAGSETDQEEAAGETVEAKVQEEPVES